MNERRADQTTCAAFWVKGIAETLEAAGLGIHALFEEAGLELTSLTLQRALSPAVVITAWGGPPSPTKPGGQRRQEFRNGSRMSPRSSMNV